MHACTGAEYSALASTANISYVTLGSVHLIKDLVSMPSCLPSLGARIPLFAPMSIELCYLRYAGLSMRCNAVPSMQSICLHNHIS
jgi:hypothetical protein